MRSVAIIIASICALLSSFVSVGSGSPARAAELPTYFQGIIGTSTSSAGEVATKNILQLNTSMFDLYAEAGLTFRKNILAQDPVILGLFSGAGGRFILYRPGVAPLNAPSMPVVYSLLNLLTAQPQTAKSPFFFPAGCDTPPSRRARTGHWDCSNRVRPAASAIVLWATDSSTVINP